MAKVFKIATVNSGDPGVHEVGRGRIDLVLRNDDHPAGGGLTILVPAFGGGAVTVILSPDEVRQIQGVRS